MFNIAKFLEKIANDIGSEENKKNIILGIIKKHTGITLSPEQIEIKNYTIYLDVNSSIQNKIFIYKRMILNDIVTSDIMVTDLR